MVAGVASNSRTTRLRLEFLRRRYNEIAEVYGCRDENCDLAAIAQTFAGGLCSMEDMGEVEALFKDRVVRFPSSGRRLDQVLDSIRTCSEKKKLQQAGLAEFLKSR
jgi:hypothetical protein